MALSQVPQDLMGQIPAGATPVDAVKVPNGEGYWILGSDGGVFAVGGAPYVGSYTGLPEAGRQGTRTFTHILDTGSTGYRLVSNRGEFYTFGQDQVPEVPKVEAPAVETTAAEPKESANIWLKGQLDQFGLGALGEWALSRYDELGSTQGAADAVFIELRQQPAYKERFAGMEKRAANKFGPMTEKEYIEWEDTYARLMQNAGMPESFYDGKDDFVNFIGNNVSPTEIKERLDDGYSAAMKAPLEVRQELERQFGITPQGLAAYFLDPDRTEAIWRKQLQQGEIGAAAQMQKFGALSTQESSRLADLGVSYGEAQEGFGLLGQQTQLTEGMAREDQLAAVGGDAEAQAAIKQEAQKKKAQFGGGGDFAAGQGGVSGLGTSNS